MDTAEAKAGFPAADAARTAAGADLASEAAKAPGAPEIAPEAPEPESAEAVAVGHTLEAWLSSHIRGGPIAQNTDCWNALMKALPALKAELLQGD